MHAKLQVIQYPVNYTLCKTYDLCHKYQQHCIDKICIVCPLMKNLFTFTNKDATKK